MPESPVTAIEPQPDLVVVRVLPERLDEEQLRQLQADVRAATGTHPGLPFVLDLAQVSFMPSLSLAGLLRLRSEFAARQQRLTLAGVQPQVRDVFVVTRLDRVFDLQDDVAAALRAIRPA
jgi:anti-anti-sigma factor